MLLRELPSLEPIPVAHGFHSSGETLRMLRVAAPFFICLIAVELRQQAALLFICACAWAPNMIVYGAKHRNTQHSKELLSGSKRIAQNIKLTFPVHALGMEQDGNTSQT